MFHEAEYNRLKARLSIDVMRLDTELMQQPMLMQSAAEETAQAIALRDAAKFTLDIVTARITDAMRTQEKPIAVTLIPTLLPKEELVQEATNEYMKTRLDVALWSSLVDAYNDKGSNLRRIAEMTMSGYLTPDTAIQQRRAEMHEARKERVRVRRNI